MTHPSDFIPAIDRVLAEIKTPGTSSARVLELQRDYRRLTGLYAKAARAHAASCPLGPVAS